MPGFHRFFAFALLGACLTGSGCTTSAALDPANLSLAAEEARQTDAATLPDSVDFRPTAFAGRTPSDGIAPLFGKGRTVTARSPELDRLIARYADHYDVPESLVRRVVKRESNFDPAAKNRIYWGLMQIRHDTAQTMGYRGPASGLLDAETNLRYAVRYLRGAWITAGGNPDLAVSYYSRGYYYDAKRKGLLRAAGLRD